ncbi:MAG TPA: SMP-30/gluconolactonase/LRE family protein [Candidatus Baltobacteraceae bacterium]|jgi:sugar lactone lactonase YvrE
MRNVLLLFLVIAAGCSSPLASSALGGSTVPAIRQARSASGYLYVANNGGNSVTVYSDSAGKLARTYSVGVNRPTALALDAASNLYVANACCRGSSAPSSTYGSVTVYSSSSAALKRTITDGVWLPRSLAFDTSNDLYVAGAAGVAVYAPGKSTVSRNLNIYPYGSDLPRALAFDPSGNLYVAAFPGDAYDSGGSSIAIYAPGATSANSIIFDGLRFPNDLAFDSAGNLYVGNDPRANNPKSTIGNVVVYPPGATAPSQTITNGIGAAAALAFDSDGNLYVANVRGKKKNSASIAVFAPGATSPKLTITKGIHSPDALAFDTAGFLYVANYTANTVTEYNRGTGKLRRTITRGISHPTALLFSEQY